jgi:hypothetical protein
MNCSAFRSHLEELSPDGFPCGEAQSHAAACPACAEFYREHCALSQLIQSINPVSASPDFDDKLNARLDAARHARPTPRFLYLDFIPGSASIVFASFLCSPFAPPCCSRKRNPAATTRHRAARHRRNPSPPSRIS